MKKLVLLPLLAIVAMSAYHVTNAVVDTNASTITWTGYKVTGKHTGNVKVKNGTLALDHGKLVGGSFEIDMSSITCTDLDGEYGNKLVGHLKSADFFGTDTYPTAKFVITRAIPQDTKGNYKVIGDLTIKTSTHSQTLKVTVSEANRAFTASGTMVIDRSMYDVKYGSGSFFDGLGDKTIYDEFDLNFNVVAK